MPVEYYSVKTLIPEIHVSQYSLHVLFKYLIYSENLVTIIIVSVETCFVKFYIFYRI